MNRNWLIQASSVLVFVALFASSPAQAGPYDFDDDNKNDMRSAWLMCATTGFLLGECPQVFVKCWQPPLIYLRRHRTHFHIETHCIRLPSWDTSSGAINNALAYAEANQPEAVAYSAGPAPADFTLTPQICLDAPYLCPSEEDEAAYEAIEAAQAVAQAEFEACIESGAEGCTPPDAIDETPPICLDNPTLCEDLVTDDTEEPDDGTVPEFTHPICEDNPGLCDDVLAGSR